MYITHTYQQAVLNYIVLLSMYITHTYQQAVLNYMVGGGGDDVSKDTMYVLKEAGLMAR